MSVGDPLPAPKTVVDLDYEPNGPYRVVRWPGHFDYETDDLDDAVRMFIRYGTPPLRAVVTQVLDVDGVIVVGADWSTITADQPSWVLLNCAADPFFGHPLVDALLALEVEEARRT